MFKEDDVVFVRDIDNLTNTYKSKIIIRDAEYEFIVYKKNPFFITHDMMEDAVNSELGPYIGVVKKVLTYDDGIHPSYTYYKISFKLNGEFENRYYVDWMIQRAINREGYCFYCGDTSTHKFDGLYLCEEHYEQVAKKCNVCGKVHNRAHMKLIDGVYVCSDCITTVPVCSSCGNYHINLVKVYRYDTRDYVMLCEACVSEGAKKCEHCGEYYIGRSVYSDSDGAYICEKCATELGFVRCSVCGTLFRQDSNDNDMICSDCIEDVIRGYHHNPSTVFHRTENQKPRKHYYMGFELESGGSTSYGKVKRACFNILQNNGGENNLYFSKDSSIPNYGVEMISQPMTLDFHKQFGWKSILRNLRLVGLKSSTRCGLHIHVSRNAFTIGTDYDQEYGANQWAKLDLFLNTHQKQFIKLSRRCESSYATFKACYSYPVSGKKYKNTYGFSEGRYTALNFTNDRTVEFRLFRSTLDYGTLIATLELVDAMIQWIKTISVVQLVNPEKNKVFSKFMKYCQDNRSEYKELFIYLIKKGFISGVKIK